MVDCPFCGQRGARTDEHVWAQWLHDMPGAKQLLAGTYGERIQRRAQRTRLGQDGRYELYQDSVGQFAKWLPHVTVRVCAQCNNGWMSQLETSAKDILGPYYRSGRPIMLTQPDLQVLSAWVMKSWMAYALTRPLESNPFTEHEYRQMALDQTPPARATIWLLNSHSRFAQVAMGIESTLMSQGEELPDLASAPDNTGLAYFAAATVVMYLALAPPDAPEDFVQLILTPNGAKHPGTRKIWPTSRPQYYPLEPAPEALIQSLKDFPDQLFSALGLPVHGLSPEETFNVREAFRAGAEPATLRRQWSARRAEANADLGLPKDR